MSSWVIYIFMLSGILPCTSLLLCLSSYVASNDLHHILCSVVGGLSERRASCACRHHLRLCQPASQDGVLSSLPAQRERLPAPWLGGRASQWLDWRGWRREPGLGRRRRRWLNLRDWHGPQGTRRYLNGYACGGNALGLQKGLGISLTELHPRDESGRGARTVERMPLRACPAFREDSGKNMHCLGGWPGRWHGLGAVLASALRHPPLPGSQARALTRAF